jgi:hypothetical protein
MSAFSFENMQTEIAATLDGGKVGFFMNIHTGWFWNKFGKKTVIGDDEKKSLPKKFSYKSFFVFEIQMIENLVKIVSALLS